MRRVVISGPSGVGKGELIRLLKEDHPKTFTTTVSHTTRKPRPGEIPGQHYHFVSASTFQDMIQKVQFAEYTQCPSGEYYGTSLQAIKAAEETGLTILFVTDIEGAQQLSLIQGFRALYIFIKPINFETLEKQLKKRRNEKKKDIKKRLERAREEVHFADKLGLYDHIILNDVFEAALRDLHLSICGQTRFGMLRDA